MRYNLILVSLFTLITAQEATCQPFLKALLEVTGERYDDALGMSVLALGDINGDGWPDFGVSVGGRRQFWIYYGGPGILDDKVDAILVGGRNAAIGDFNGDGYPDLISVKPILSDVANFDTAYVYLGKSGPGLMLDTIPAYKIPSGNRSGEFGRYMAVGDLNRDGIDDLAISEPSNGRGVVYIFMGKHDFDGVPDFTGTIDSAYGGYGTEIQIVDVNGDGIKDLAFGLSHYGMDGWWYRCHIYHGSPNWTFDHQNPSQFLDSRFIPGVDSSKLNFESPRIVDIDGDGISDVVAWHRSVDGERKPLYVFYGTKGTISNIPSKQIQNPNPSLYTGFMGVRPIQTSGDINGNGFNDYALRVGTFPQVYVLYHPGSPQGFHSYSFAISSGGTDEYGQYGENLSSVGDINRDGMSDIIVSSPKEPRFFYSGYFHILAGDRNLVGIENLQAPKIEALLIENSWPNPFNSMTTVEIRTVDRTHTYLTIKDILGREVAMLYDGFLESGTHPIVWDGKTKSGTQAKNGVYFFTATTKESIHTRIIHLLRNH